MCIDYVLCCFPKHTPHVRRWAYSNCQLNLNLSCFMKIALNSFWTNMYIVQKCPKLFYCILFLFFYCISKFIYIFELGFSHVNSILTEESCNLDIEFHANLRLKFTSFEPNIPILSRITCCNHHIDSINIF